MKGVTELQWLGLAFSVASVALLKVGWVVCDVAGCVALVCAMAACEANGTAVEMEQQRRKEEEWK